MRFLLIPCILSLILTTGCLTPPAGSIIPGTWEVTEAHSEMPGIAPHILIEADMKFIGSTYSFNKNGILLIEEPGSRYPGTWSINHDENIISLSYWNPDLSDSLNYNVEIVRWGKLNIQLKQAYDYGFTMLSLQRID